LISDKLRGLNEKWLGYLISELISNRKCRGLGAWLVDQRQMAGPRVHRGLPPVADGKAHREGGDGTGTTRRDREATHPSPDDGEEAAR
jgi:hypothetical protein